MEQAKRDVALKVAENLRDQPEAIKELEAAGLISPDILERLELGLGIEDMIREFRGGIIDLIQEKPSAMAKLEVRPLDLMVDETKDLTGSTVMLAILFSDLEGFTGFNDARGDTEAAALLRDHYDAARSIVLGHGGTVIKTIGDGHMLSFPTAAGAVLAGLDLIDAAPDPLRVRVGGHVGQAIRTGGDLLGNAVNLAARVTNLAEGGSGIATRALRDGAGMLPGVAFGTVRAEVVKGVEGPVEVCAILRA